MTFAFATTALPAGRGIIARPTAGNVPFTYADAIRLWRHDAAFRIAFTAHLAAAPFVAYRWETPAVTAATAGQPFEFVLLDAPSLDRPADPAAFADMLSTDGPVATFPNLGRDATLVVPRPGGPAYPHLAAFARLAPADQQHALWQAVGDAMVARLGPAPVWLNTAGAGVPWLHVRLDDRPKYYAHRPYAVG